MLIKIGIHRKFSRIRAQELSTAKDKRFGIGTGRPRKGVDNFETQFQIEYHLLSVTLFSVNERSFGTRLALEMSTAEG